MERSAVSADLLWKCFSTGEVKAMKNGPSSATTVAGSAALPFVISTEAQRSGEICGVSGPSLGMFFDSDKNGFYLATTLPGSAALPFVISTGAQRSGEICGVSGPSLGMFFDRAQLCRKTNCHFQTLSAPGLAFETWVSPRSSFWLEKL